MTNEGTPAWVRDGMMTPEESAAKRSERYRFLWASEQDGWSTVTHGPDLPYPFDIKLARRGHRMSLVGLRIDLRGPDQSREVTSRNLRQIRVGQLLDELAAMYSKPENLEGQGSDYEPSLWFWRESVNTLNHAARELPPVEPAKQGRAPSEDQLKRFVGIYAGHLKAGRRNAMTRATRQANMARSTGYRWLDLAREQGLLEGLDDDQD